MFRALDRSYCAEGLPIGTGNDCPVSDIILVSPAEGLPVGAGGSVLCSRLPVQDAALMLTKTCCSTACRPKYWHKSHRISLRWSWLRAWCWPKLTSKSRRFTFLTLASFFCAGRACRRRRYPNRHDRQRWRFRSQRGVGRQAFAQPCRATGCGWDVRHEFRQVPAVGRSTPDCEKADGQL